MRKRYLVNAENTVEHKYLSIRYTEVCMKKIIKQKNSHIWMEKQFSHMFLGFIVVIFNFLKVRGGGGGGRSD